MTQCPPQCRAPGPAKAGHYVLRCCSPPARERQHNLHPASTLRTISRPRPPVVRDDDLLHEREPEARALRLRREERMEHALRVRSRGTRDRCRKSTACSRRPRDRPRTSMLTSGGTPAAAQASMPLRSRLLNAWRSSTSSPSMVANSPLTVMAPVQRPRVGLQILRGALGDGPEIHRRRASSCVGRAKLRKFVTTSRSASVSARMPSTYGRYAGGSASRSNSLL